MKDSVFESPEIPKEKLQLMLCQNKEAMLTYLLRRIWCQHVRATQGMEWTRHSKYCPRLNPTKMPNSTNNLVKGKKRKRKRKYIFCESKAGVCNFWATAHYCSELGRGSAWVCVCALSSSCTNGGPTRPCLSLAQNHPLPLPVCKPVKVWESCSKGVPCWFFVPHNNKQQPRY